MNEDTVYTPTQTCGPLFGFAMLPKGITEVPVPAGKRALHLTVEILDGAGNHLDYGAWVEFWDATQACRVRTLAGQVKTTMIWPEARQLADGSVLAPQINVVLVTRGLAQPLATKMFLPDTPELTADPVWNAVPEERRHLMLAEPTEEGFHFVWKLQGEDENPVFDLYQDNDNV